jgi:hypothetical protein|tara:strand:+ start:4462 stop:4677 length:216 start_codon:yes stop_codon:yes gene_type:complete
MQRKGKSHKAAMGSDGRVALGEIIDFMNECAGVLELEGDEKSAFYFEQIAEFLTENPYKGLKEHAGRVLGL